MKEFGSISGCPDENSLLAYTRGALSVRSRSEVEVHIDSCSSCRRVLSVLAQSSSTTPAPALSLEITTDPGVDAGVPAPGALLDGRFRVISIIGRGAMGIVFEALDEKLNEKVALKLLAPHIASRPDVMEMLRRETLLGRKISHPNVCRLYDLGVSGPFKFITQQLVKGRTLEEVLAGSRLDEGTAAAILGQLASALAAAHQMGVVHRDLKTSNIMLGDGNHVWVMDFGLARDMEKDPSYSGPVGTPAYWSPEQAHGEPATAASDVYSFGVIAYRLFVGHLPKRHLQDLPFDVIPRRYRAVVRRCLALKVADRFPNGSELLSAWAGTQAPSAPRTVAVFAGVGMMATAVGVGFLAVYLWHVGHATPPTLPMPAERPPPQYNQAVPALPRPPKPEPADGHRRAEPALTPEEAASAEPAPTAGVQAPEAATKDGGEPVKRRAVKRPKNDFPLFE